MTEYKKKLESLTRSFAGWDCLSRSRNPVLNVLRSPGAELEMVEAVRQYCFLPATIVEYLTIGSQRLAGWSAAGAELKRNRAEELGSKTGGVTHYELLASGLRSELGIGLEGSRPSATTARFLQRVRRELWNQPPAFAAGMLYALESSAVSELFVVAEILNQVAKLARQAPVVDIPDLLENARVERIYAQHPDGLGLSLAEFITLHVQDFEIGHELGLATAFEPYIDTIDSFADFEAGFQLVLQEMQDWWDGLAVDLRALCAQPTWPERTREPNLSGVPL